MSHVATPRYQYFRFIYIGICFSTISGADEIDLISIPNRSCLYESLTWSDCIDEAGLVLDSIFFCKFEYFCRDHQHTRAVYGGYSNCQYCWSQNISPDSEISTHSSGWSMKIHGDPMRHLDEFAIYGLTVSSSPLRDVSAVHGRSVHAHIVHIWALVATPVNVLGIHPGKY